MRSRLTSKLSIGPCHLRRQGMPSYVTEDLTQTVTELTDAEIRERMSGNICRCAAYCFFSGRTAPVSLHGQGHLNPLRSSAIHHTANYSYLRGSGPSCCDLVVDAQLAEAYAEECENRARRSDNVQGRMTCGQRMAGPIFKSAGRSLAPLSTSGAPVRPTLSLRHPRAC